MNYIYAAAGTLILFFIVQILQKRKKNVADYFLVGVNLMIGLFLLADVLVNWKLSSGTIIFQNAVPFFLFPVFVCYVLQFVYAHKRIAPAWALIFLPGIAFLGLCIIDHYVLGNYPTQADLNTHFNTPSIWYQFFFKGTQLLFIGILAWLLRALTRFEQELKEGYSTIETIDVRWLKHFTWVYLGSIIITFVLFLSQNLGLLPLEIKQVFGVVYGVLVLSVFYMNYHGIRHYTLAQVHPINQGEEAPLPTAPIQVEEKGRGELTHEEQELEKEILHLIETEQTYLQPKFSLNELAERLGKSRHEVSRIINAREDRTFYDLINGYRVDHLKKMLNDPANTHFTILSMGLDSGFNSKASLNRIFKNITGLTPRQYLDQKSQPVG